MFSVILTWTMVAWGALSCIYMLRCAWARFPKRDVDDVIPFLYPVNLALAKSLLDPASEFEYRWRLSPREFRAAQRKRMRLYLELTRRMAHNSRVLVEYAVAEKNNPDPRRVSVATDLQDRAIEMRLYVLLAGARLKLWLFLRSELLTGTNKLSLLRTAGEIDGLQTYCALRTAATAAFVHLPAEARESLTRNL
jgi:hypothetical protein